MIHTAAPSSASEQQTDGSPICTCMRKTLGCSIHPNTPGEWIASQQDSLAKILALPELEQVSRENVAGYGWRLRGVLTYFDRGTCSWKTPQQSLLGGSVSFSETWPAWGTMHGGVCSVLPRSVPRTFAPDGGASPNVPTPTCQDNNQVAGQYANPNSGTTLGGYVRMNPTPTASMMTIGDMEQAKYAGNDPNRPKYKKVNKWPTPNATDYKGASTRSEGKDRPRCNDDLPTRVLNRHGGPLNPMWVEWLMGWPLGHTVSRLWETAKSRSRRRRRGKF